MSGRLLVLFAVVIMALALIYAQWIAVVIHEPNLVLEFVGGVALSLLILALIARRSAQRKQP